MYKDKTWKLRDMNGCLNLLDQRDLLNSTIPDVRKVCSVGSCVKSGSSTTLIGYYRLNFIPLKKDISSHSASVLKNVFL